MADDDECDLETLSALLDENSDDDTDQLEPAAQPASRDTTLAAHRHGRGRDSPGDLIAERHEPDDVHPDDIAAFFNDASDSDDEDGFPKQKISSPEVQEKVCKENKQTAEGSTSTKAASELQACSKVQSGNDHVKQLQDELMMMQQRMLEIQRQLAAQSQTQQSTPAPQQLSDNPTPEVSRNHARPGLQILDDGDENMFFDKPSSSSPISSTSSSSKLSRPDCNSKSSGNKPSRVASHRKPAGQTDNQQRASKQYSTPDGVTPKTERTSGLSSSKTAHRTASSKSPNSFNSSGSASSGELVQSQGVASANRTGASVVVKPDPEHGDEGVMKRDLFGEDSDSDWEDMDGEKPTLSAQGKEIKNIMKRGFKQRQAHVPNYSPSKVRSLTSTAVWKETANTSKRQAPSMDQHPKPTLTNKGLAEADDKNCITEKKSNIRIVNPVISSSSLQAKMEGRRLIQLSALHRKVNTPDIQGDWVTIGVIVHKTDARKSSNGNTFCILKLNDLQDVNETVSFFLFGQVYKQLWKTDVGTVLGILNPDIMDPIEKNASEVSFNVKNPAQVMILGRSKDLGWCIGKTKHGNKCSKFVNKKFGDFCEYHVAAAYKKTSAQRGELQGSCPGKRPKSFKERFLEKHKIAGNAYKFSGGFVQTGIQKGPSDKDKVTLAKLQEQQLQQKRKVTTMSIQDLPPLAQDNIKTSLVKDEDKTFLDMMTTPTVGSMNLLKHIVHREGHEKVTKDNKGTVTYRSVQATDLLKEHRKSLQEKKHQKSAAPVLGKGFQPGQDIDLFSGFTPRTQKPQVSKSDVAKLKAIKKIQAKGGIEKADPNAVRKSSQNVDGVKKRVLEQVENDSNKRRLSDESGQGSSDDSGKQDAAPARKKSRFLGNVDLNSEEVQQLLKAKSSHKGALAEAEAEKEEQYFESLEKKEMMEEKMKTVTSLETTVFSCEQCKYTALSASERCKQEGHKITRHKGKKRFFECKKCKHRITSLQKFPTEPCKNCGELSFEKCSMYKERSGPKLESEILCIRGDEIKYLNSLQQKVYL